MPFPKKQLFIQSHSVDLCTENRALFFEENWNLKVKAVCNAKSIFFLVRLKSMQLP